MHGEATVGANREGHGSLAGRPILGGEDNTARRGNPILLFYCTPRKKSGMILTSREYLYHLPC